MKYIFIPIFRLITLPLFMLFILMGYIALCIKSVWHWDLKYIKSFETEFCSFKKNKPFMVIYEWNNYPAYKYDTIFNYIMNKKS